MIDYELFCKMKLAIETKYKNGRQLFSELSNKTYPGGIKQWDGYGVRIISSSFTVAVVCEYDENSPNDGVYVGVKVLDGIPTCGQNLSTYLQRKYGINQCKYQFGANNRCFYWPCWKTITGVQQGIGLFDDLLKDCDAYLQSVI